MMVRSLVEIFHTKPPGVLERAVSPEMGIAAKHKFLSLADVNEWMDKTMASYERREPKQALLEKQDEPEVSVEERRRRSEILKGLARKIRARNIVSTPTSVKALQKHDPDALIAALGGDVRDSAPLREEDAPPK